MSRKSDIYHIQIIFPSGRIISRTNQINQIVYDNIVFIPGALKVVIRPDGKGIANINIFLGGDASEYIPDLILNRNITVRVYYTLGGGDIINTINTRTQNVSISRNQIGIRVRLNSGFGQIVDYNTYFDSYSFPFASLITR